MEYEDYADSLLVTEVFAPAGHWSFYPSHCHDEDDYPRITPLEEICSHRLNPACGFYIQRVYTVDARLGETMSVAIGIVVLVPRGPAACPIGSRCTTSMSWPDLWANNVSFWHRNSNGSWSLTSETGAAGGSQKNFSPLAEPAKRTDLRYLPGEIRCSATKAS